MTDLAEFLLARIADTIAHARAVQAQGVTDGLEADDPRRPELSLARWAIKDAEAKRRIVEHHARVEWDDGELGCAVCGVDILPPLDGVQVRESAGWPCPTMSWLALPHADHPDCREEWRP